MTEDSSFPALGHFKGQTLKSDLLLLMLYSMLYSSTVSKLLYKIKVTVIFYVKSHLTFLNTQLKSERTNYKHTTQGGVETFVKYNVIQYLCNKSLCKV